MKSVQVPDVLTPWLEGSGPNEIGEWGMHCPMHDDLTRSASLNVEKGVFFCQVCERGSTMRELVSFLRENPDITPEHDSNGGSSSGNGQGHKAPLSQGQVSGWASALFSNKRALTEFMHRRGISKTTLKEYEIGWDSGNRAYTIPVRSSSGDLLNVRFYQLDPVGDRRKIWGLPGRNTPVLYPGRNLRYLGDSVIICEGELDALCTIQKGFDVVTRTGAAKVWKPEWNGVFKNKIVYLCHDRDTPGQEANRKVAAALEGVAAEIYVVNLPYPLTEKHGKDLTDFWLDEHDPEDLMALMMEAEPWADLDEAPVEDVRLVDLKDTTVLGSFDSANVGKPLRMHVTITGKRSPAYLVPEKVEYKCEMNAGVKCTVCPMNSEGYNGHTTYLVSAHDPMLLEMLGTTSKVVDDLLRAQITPIKCGKLTIERQDERAVEELLVRPSVEMDQSTMDIAAGDYMTRKIISVGRHDSMTSNTVTVVGSIFPSPKTQHNEFMAWEIEHLETSVDHFEMTEENVALMRQFQADGDPLEKLRDIAKDLASHVTRIYGRPEMHMLMDLVYHSILAYPFEGKLERRGWLDAIIVGDTRTGKSEAAQSIRAWYGAGEYVACESASFAGVVGGLQQISNKEWSVTWGAIPINDRRLCILDEVSGLTVEQIGQMSSIRSSGEAQLTKIQSERTHARTRLLWLGNPRQGQLSDYTYGVQALQPLIGAPEDIARFDLAMSVNKRDVPSEEINRTHKAMRQRYSKEAYQTMLGWCWSRKPENVKWSRAAEQLVYKLAVDAGKRYSEDPPLVQAANVRVKLARVAVAIAARLFSTDDTHENVVVGVEHVRAARDFMDTLYTLNDFGYADISSSQESGHAKAVENRDEAKAFVIGFPGLVKFLKNTDSFKPMDLGAIGLSHEEQKQIISKLYLTNLLKLNRGVYTVSPVLREIVLNTSEDL